MSVRRIYWDTSCFISFLSGSHPEEVERSLVCEDILQHARNDKVEIWTSVWTIVETIRPKVMSQPCPMPPWAELLNQEGKDGQLIYPDATPELSKIWNYYQKNTLSTRLLSEKEALRIKQMFDWPWLRKVQVMPSIAQRGAEIARSHNIKPGDALHFASALSRGCEVLQRWDKDYRKTDTLIKSEDPVRLSPNMNLLLALEPPPAGT